MICYMRISMEFGNKNIMQVSSCQFDIGDVYTARIAIHTYTRKFDLNENYVR